MKNLQGTEYAGALKSALLMRKNGIIDRATDDQLGLIIQNIVRWAIADMVTAGKLWRTVSADPDFNADILLKVLSKLDRLDLDKAPKQILIYLKRIATNYVKNYVRDMSRLKRQHEDVSLDDCDAVVNFAGDRVH